MDQYIKLVYYFFIIEDIIVAMLTDLFFEEIVLCYSILNNIVND